MKSSQKSKSHSPILKALSRQHSLHRQDVLNDSWLHFEGPALQSTVPRAAAPVVNLPQSRDVLLSPFSRFNSAPVFNLPQSRDALSPFSRFDQAQLPVSVYNPLPRRMMSPRSITQATPVPVIPDLVRENEWQKLQEQNRVNFGLQRQQFERQTELPPRLSPNRRSAQAVSIFELFKKRMHMESENTILVLDDGTSIDMGNVDIDTALRMLRRVEYTEYGVVTYIIDGFPIEMGIFDGRIVLLYAPKSGGGRTRSRKIVRKGIKGRKGTNKRRRYMYIVTKTRLRRGNKPPRTLIN